MKKETENLIEIIKKDLMKMMSEKRYNHSIGVMEKCIELAQIYNVDVDEAALAGLTHDIAKEIPDDEAFKIAEINNIHLDEVERSCTYLIHGKIGAQIVKEKYGFNEKIQNAIINHTTTSVDMDMLSKIVFVADKTEDTRNDDVIDVDEERNISTKCLDDAVILIIDNSIKKLVMKGKVIHPETIRTRNRLIMNKQKG